MVIGTLSGMETYYANDSTVGCIRSGEYPFAIGVLLASDDSRPSGIAFEIGSTIDGLAIWRLKVGGERVPGRFIIEDGRFVPVEPMRGRRRGGGLPIGHLTSCGHDGLADLGSRQPSIPCL